MLHCTMPKPFHFRCMVIRRRDYALGGTISYIPSQHLSTFQARCRDHLGISGEQIDSLIRPLRLVPFYIQHQTLDGLFAIKRDLVAIDVDRETWIRENQVFPRFWPVGISSKDLSRRGILESSLDDDGFRDLTIGSADRLTGYVSLPDLSGSVGLEGLFVLVNAERSLVQVESLELDLNCFGLQGGIAAP